MVERCLVIAAGQKQTGLREEILADPHRVAQPPVRGAVELVISLQEQIDLTFRYGGFRGRADLLQSFAGVHTQCDRCESSSDWVDTFLARVALVKHRIDDSVIERVLVVRQPLAFVVDNAHCG